MITHMISLDKNHCRNHQCFILVWSVPFSFLVFIHVFGLIACLAILNSFLKYQPHPALLTLCGSVTHHQRPPLDPCPNSASPSSCLHSNRHVFCVPLWREEVNPHGKIQVMVPAGSKVTPDRGTHGFL